MTADEAFQLTMDTVEELRVVGIRTKIKPYSEHPDKKRFIKYC